jgi:hypothetical protein
MEQSRPMPLMHTLRNTPWLARLALLWFVMTVGVAVASPMVNPQQELIICSAAGMVKVKLHADGSISTEANSELSCPLCVVGNAAPPALVSLQPAPVLALTYVQPGIVIDPLVAHSAAPPPSRGPPAFL